MTVMVFMGSERRRGLPGNLRDKRLELLGFISPGERPAHVAGGVAHIGTNTACSPLFLIGQGLDNEWDNCKQTEMKLVFLLKNKKYQIPLKIKE